MKSSTLALVLALMTSVVGGGRARADDESAAAQSGPGGGQVPGRPQGQSELALPPAALIEAVVVTEQLGAVVPLDARFRVVDGRVTDGTLTTLRDVVTGDLPVLLTFNYTNCPSLCSAQLNGVVKALAAARLVPGRQFRLVTIVLAPDEPVADAGRTRARYVAELQRLGGSIADRGWTFLVATGPDDDRAIRAVADAVGFGYRYIATQREYAHPAAIIALAPSGTVTRYLHGVEPTSAEVDETITRAGLSEQSSAAGFVMACLHWDPAANSRRWGRTVLQITALAFFAIGALVAGVLVTRRRRVPGVNPS